MSGGWNCNLGALRWLRDAQPLLVDRAARNRRADRRVTRRFRVNIQIMQRHHTKRAICDTRSIRHRRALHNNDNKRSFYESSRESIARSNGSAMPMRDRM